MMKEVRPGQLRKFKRGHECIVFVEQVKMGGFPCWPGPPCDVSYIVQRGKNPGLRCIAELEQFRQDTDEYEDDNR